MASDVKMMKELVRLANRTKGWSAGTTGRRTLFIGPEGKYWTSATPGGHRAIKNTKADLRRRGLPC
jgi:hypothetical protein